MFISSNGKIKYINLLSSLTLFYKKYFLKPITSVTKVYVHERACFNVSFRLDVSKLDMMSTQLGLCNYRIYHTEIISLDL